MKHPLMPKGSACALHLTNEFKEGQQAEPRTINPYDFFDEYTKHYAFDIGNQEKIKSTKYNKSLCVPENRITTQMLS